MQSRIKIENFEPLKIYLDRTTLEVPPPSEEVISRQLDWFEQSEFWEDPYWPKWQAPWWSILSFLDLKLIDQIPPRVLNRFVEKIQSHYINDFPLIEENIPKGCDPYRHIMCFCAAGSLYRLLDAIDLNPFATVPLLKKLYTEFQMSDGGFNCDESAYNKDVHKSSAISTLVMIEPLSYENSDSKWQPILKMGLESLVQRDFVYSSSGKVIDQDWLKPAFPLFYNYDLIRAYEVLINAVEFHDYESEIVLNSLSQLNLQDLNFQGVLDLERDTLRKDCDSWKFEGISKFPPILEWIQSNKITEICNHNRLVRLASRISEIGT